MSDDIQCCVDGCHIDAEIEVERGGAYLWICGEHYKVFIKPSVDTPTEKEQMVALFEKLGVCYKVDDDPYTNEEDTALDSKIHVPGEGRAFGAAFQFNKAGDYLGVDDMELCEFHPRGTHDG